MNTGFIFKTLVVAIPSGLGVALTFKDIWEWLKDGGKDKRGGKRKNDKEAADYFYLLHRFIHLECCFSG